MTFFGYLLFFGHLFFNGCKVLFMQKQKKWEPNRDNAIYKCASLWIPKSFFLGFSIGMGIEQKAGERRDSGQFAPNNTWPRPVIGLTGRVTLGFLNVNTVLATIRKARIMLFPFMVSLTVPPKCFISLHKIFNCLLQKGHVYAHLSSAGLNRLLYGRAPLVPLRIFSGSETQ